MRANHSDQNLHQTYSLDIVSKNNDKDRDAISCASFNIEQTPTLYYTPSHPKLTADYRRTSSTKRLTSIDLKGNGMMINGSLFDAQLFQPSHSSHVFDYNETPPELNRFIEGHHSKSKESHLNAHLFQLSFILTLSEWHTDRELLLDYCPHVDSQTHILEEIGYYKRFCFPELNSKAEDGGSLIRESGTYVFTRTTGNGQAEYGFCRRITYENQITKFPVVICIVSTYSYFKLYDAILDELAAAYVSNERECSLLMQSFYSKPLPIPTLQSSGIVCKLNNRRVFYYICPTDDRLNHDYFSTLLSAVSPSSIVYLFEAMLRSKKILCFSHSLSKLTKCCLGLSSLLYPFSWTYPFVSLMPSSWLHDLLDSPCPYIYGCLYETLQEIPSTMDRDSIRVDLDSNTVDVGLNDGFLLPPDLRQTLNASLEYLIRFRLIKSDSTLINIAISEACLRVFTELFYRLPDFFQRDDQMATKQVDDGSESSLVSSKRKEANRLGYDFRSDEFLILQPSSPYVTFLNDFIRGMICLKFLDDYQRPEQSFALFTQRLNERRRITTDQLTQSPVIRFRQTFDLLEKQIKHPSRSANAIFSRLVKKFF